MTQERFPRPVLVCASCGREACLAGDLLCEDAVRAGVTGTSAGPPLTHFFHCWRFPDHHACAVALIERQGEENTALIHETGTLKRALRDHGMITEGGSSHV